MNCKPKCKECVTSELVPKPAECFISYSKVYALSHHQQSTALLTYILLSIDWDAGT